MTAAERRDARWNRTVAESLGTVFGDDLVRRGERTRDGELEGPDVAAPGLWIECERDRDADPGAILYEAERAAAGAGLWPIAVCGDGGRVPTVHMRFDHFTELLREWWSARSRRDAQ